MTRPAEMVRRSKCPVINIERTKFMRIVDLTGLEIEYVPLRFEYDVHWLRESMTQSFLKTSFGDIIFEGSRFVDSHSFLSSVSATEHAKRWQKERGLEPNGDIFSESVVSIIDKPVIVPPSNVIEGSTAGIIHPDDFLYMEIPNDWMLDDQLAQARLEGWNKPNPDFVFYDVSRLLPVTTEFVVWSSLHSDAENDAAMANMLGSS